MTRHAAVHCYTNYYYHIFEQINVNSCYFWTFKRLHIWTIHVTHLNDFSYTSGRFGLRISTIFMAGLRISRLIDRANWHFMAWKGMLSYNIIHNINCTAWLYSTYALIHYISQGICYISGWFMLHIWTMEVTYLDDCYISGRWRSHIWTGVTYLDDGGYISGRLLYIWTMEVTYLDDCNISGRWRLHIWTTVTYLDEGGYISGRLLHIWTVTYLHVTRHHNVTLNSKLTGIGYTRCYTGGCSVSHKICNTLCFLGQSYILAVF